MAFSQSNFTIQSFDAPLPDTTVVGFKAMESGTTLDITTDLADKMEGTASIDVKTSLAAVHQWGTYSQFGVTRQVTTPWDFSGSDSISIWIKVRQAPTHPEYMVLRIEFGDRPTSGDAQEMYIYENTTILDGVHDWINLKVPLLERNQPGTDVPDSTGFILAPTSWGGFNYNNKVLDRDKITEWNLGVITTGWDPVNPLPADSIDVSFDGFERFGVRSFPVIIFAGKDWPAYVGTPWAWGQSSIAIEQNAGTVPGENAVKWTQGDEWSNGWTGFGMNFSSNFNMAGAWQKDSLKMMIKADSVGPLRAQFESSGGKKGIVFAPIQDGQWHQYVLALRDFVPQDGTTGFDSSAINVFGIMAEASGKAGRIIYLTEVWTGTPTIDVIPPPPPQNLQALGASFTNLLTWDAVPNEPGVRYSVYFADHAWTDPADSTVEDIPPYNLTSALANHLLRAPGTDENVSYYYGVTAKDAAGNISAPGVTATASTPTMAKGVPTISLTPPATFVPDGDLTEWSGITPVALSVISGTAHDVPNYRVTGGDADLSVKAYLAVDAKNLYVAFDVTDDHVVVDTTGGSNNNDYMQDCPDLFIGLYDWRGPHHTGYTGGATPDYHFRFSKNRIWIDNSGTAEVMHAGNPNYAWVEKVLTSGYTVEAKIPWDTIAVKLASRHDAVFSPKEGMRIPIDYAINDRDDPAPGTSDRRHAIMCYSPITNDNSWSDMYYWTNTWIGNKWTVGVKQTSDVPRKYALEQNYPNPFNPSTQIRYSLEKSGMVNLKVYDVIGREVATLVNTNQDAGSYSVNFDAAKAGRGLASGVYFYRLEAGSFVATHKMMVLK